MKNSVWEERRSGKSLNRKDDPRTLLSEIEPE